MCIFLVKNNTISVWNNGKGIPVVQHKVEKVFVPALIFGQLLTSSNYDDDEKKVTGETDCFYFIIVYYSFIIVFFLFQI